MIVNGCLESLWIRDIEELIIFSNDDLRLIILLLLVKYGILVLLGRAGYLFFVLNFASIYS
jgi:hypothetical protein